MRKSPRVHWRARLEQVRRQAREAVSSSEEWRRVMRRRAELLAQVEQAAAPSAEESVMVFTTGTGRYGIPLTRVTEVITDAPLAPVPGAPPEIAGVIQVRGDIRPILDLSHILGQNSGGTRNEATFLLFRHGGREMGLRIGEVEDIRTVAAGGRLPAPAGAAHAAWVTADLVVMLDLDSLWEGDV